ncbi:permease [Flavobacterium sp. 316]|uniref:Probable membrane transporter protein n=1 Tax=Flavobacterium sediminilitoris TaxID=2024526 RepID=A0ABY4HM48_9FLAO|nr:MULTISPECIES: sulfite exporter TauE/SafE family protein [Flavobacterium]KIX20035.1 permease [Flavobacterium sp. 316]UOX33741.1 sulfite exporter TauE/SafE family protein [Flavobacterium sediminilitoris]
MEVFAYIGALLIGLVLGLTGGGGSMLTVPVLVYVLHINPVVATAYSLFIVGSTSVVGAFQNYKKGLVDFHNGILFAVPSFIGVYLTRRFIIPIIPDTIITTSYFSLSKNTFLMLLFAIIMLLSAIAMLKKKKERIVKEKSSITSLIIQTFLIGILIGLIGAGGGFIIIPSLVLFAKLPMKKAIGTSLFIIAINSSIGFLGDVQNLTIDWFFLISFSAISILGILLGIFLNKFINESQLKKGFAYFVLAMAFLILVKEL